MWIEHGKVLVRDADPATFKVLTPSDPPVDIDAGGDATDQFAPYRRGKRIPLDAAHEAWRAFFAARQDRHLWWWGRR